MIEIESLLAPIRSGVPCGEDVRFSPTDLTLQQLKECRGAVDPELDPSGAGRAADWVAAARACESALSETTKDLDIAVGLTEAWARLQGFPGLCAGLSLLAQLCDRFWEALHPGAPEGGEVELEVRLAPLNWLGSPKFLRAVDGCELVASDVRPRLSWELFRFAELVDEASERSNKAKHAELLQRGLIDGAAWRARLQAAAPAALQRSYADLVQCEARLAELQRVVEKRGAEAVSLLQLAPLARRLEEIRTHLEPHGAPTGAGAPALKATEATAGVRAVGGTPQAGVQTREQALARLAEVADYYRRSEPHSPIALLVQRAVRWGGMSFEQVLPELIGDPGALARAWDTLGIRSERGDA